MRGGLTVQDLMKLLRTVDPRLQVAARAKGAGRAARVSGMRVDKAMVILHGPEETQTKARGKPPKPDWPQAPCSIEAAERQRVRAMLGRVRPPPPDPPPPLKFLTAPAPRMSRTALDAERIQIVSRALTEEPATVGELSRKTGLSISQLSRVLLPVMFNQGRVRLTYRRRRGEPQPVYSKPL